MLQHDVVRAVRQEQVWQALRTHTAGHLKRLLEALMQAERDRHLACAAYERTDRRKGYRNGYQDRRLDTTFGPLTLRKPKVRGLGPVPTLVLDRYQRRRPDVDDTVRQWLACGMSTREVSLALEDVFGTLLSAGGVSRIVARLDAEVRAFQNRSLEHGYRFVHLDAKHGHVSKRRRRRGRGKKKDAVLLLAWGVRHDDAEELVGFRVADSESGKDWTAFLTDLEKRGMRRRNQWAQELEMIVTDGDAGLLEALWMVYPRVPKQRCIFHKIRNITDHLVDTENRAAILASAADIYQDLETPHQAMYRLARWAKRWQEVEPAAVRNFVNDFEDTLTYLNAPAQWRRRLKTNNPIERFIRELNKKTNKVGIWPSAASWERATYLTWRKLQRQRYGSTARADARAPFTPDT